MHHPTRLLTLSVLIYLSTAAYGAAKPFPKLRDIATSFETNIEFTDKIQQRLAIGKEYYDFDKRIGRLDLLALGQKVSMFFSEETDQVFSVTDERCIEDVGGVAQLDLFEGWTSFRDPVYIGPSALILMAEKETVVDYDDEETYVRSIRSDRYRLQYSKSGKNLTINYYFAVSEWTMPFKGNKRFPVRITLNSTSEIVDQIIDYLYFRPKFDDKSKFVPPVGLGCYGMEPKVELPPIPKKYTFGAEGFDLLHDEKHSETDVKLYRVWYDSKRKVARLDQYTEEGVTSDLDDYEEGVQYHMHDFRTCRFRTMRKSMFLTFDYDTLVGRMKTPEEVLFLDGEDFYSLGEAEVRGQKSRVFEKVQKDVSFGDNDYKTLVTTVYFAAESTKIEVDGEDVENSPPLDIRITGYGENSEVTLKKQFQIFAFDDEPGREFYATFPIDSCFSKASQKAFFSILIEATQEIAAKVEALSPAFYEEVKSKIVKVANITVARLPFIKIDYRISGIYVTALMLDKPPILAQFWEIFDKAEIKDTAAFVIAPEAADKESCATACVGLNEPCKGFHFCGQGCFLNLGEVTDVPVDPIPFDLVCDVYIRAVSDSENNQQPLTKALQNLIDEKDANKLYFSAPVAVDEEVELPALDIFRLTEGKEGSVNDYPYNLVTDGSQFKGDAETTVEVDNIETEEECYRHCKDATTISCSSFSYCGKAMNKRCRITSVLLGGGPKDKDEIETDENCDVFSLMYLDFYDRYPGKVYVIPGNKTVENVENPEECAKNCRIESDFNCRGFEYCRHKNAKSCVLHTKHIVDLTSSESTTTTSDCIHYAARFSADYRDLGYLLIDDETNVRSEISLEECARACSEEVYGCQSFNYCPPTSVGMVDSSCSLTSKTLYDNVQTKTKEKCHLYSKREHVEDWKIPPPPPPAEKKSGYTSKGFAGLLIGMIIFGLIVGALVFVGYSYFRSRKGGDGMTVKFSKQDNI